LFVSFGPLRPAPNHLKWWLWWYMEKWNRLCKGVGMYKEKVGVVCDDLDAEDVGPQWMAHRWCHSQCQTLFSLHTLASDRLTHTFSFHILTHVCLTQPPPQSPTRSSHTLTCPPPFPPPGPGPPGAWHHGPVRGGLLLPSGPGAVCGAQPVTHHGHSEAAAGEHR
jgi:hypothetical protein